MTVTASPVVVVERRDGRFHCGVLRVPDWPCPLLWTLEEPWRDGRSGDEFRVEFFEAHPTGWGHKAQSRWRGWTDAVLAGGGLSRTRKET